MALTPEQQTRVLDSAIELFAKKNLTDITLDHVTKSSGVSAFDIVRHYHSKENILAAVLERELELMSSAALATDLRMPGETIKDELQLLARVILEEHRRRLPFLGKLLVESLSNPEVGALFYKTFIVQGRLLFTQFLKTRQQVGDVREVLDIEVAAAMFLSFLTSVVIGEVSGGSKVENIDEERVITQMSDILLNGIRKK
ncbi:MAG: TetR/AcrR family transcriptional regulator [Bryobacteraceae bacterium]